MGYIRERSTPEVPLNKERWIDLKRSYPTQNEREFIFNIPASNHAVVLDMTSTSELTRNFRWTTFGSQFPRHSLEIRSRHNDWQVDTHCLLISPYSFHLSPMNHRFNSQIHCLACWQWQGCLLVLATSTQSWRLPPVKYPRVSYHMTQLWICVFRLQNWLPKLPPQSLQVQGSIHLCHQRHATITELSWAPRIDTTAWHLQPLAGGSSEVVVDIRA